MPTELFMPHSIAIYIQRQVMGDLFSLQHTAGVFWCSMTQ